ncbi:MAG: hypothetical protein HOJ35_03835, partial [Bdellovibrionales bacterium]|nr:hypothetical protein [Bdellovibrionales bacterium]
MKEEKFTEDEYELTTDELDYYSLLNEYNMQPEMGELNNQKYKIHRIIFEDILIDPSYPLEDGVDRSLSIPFYDGIRSVWAPNGYGKTFAFKMLGLLNKSGQRAKQSDVIRNHKNMEDFLNNFFQSCYNELHSPDNNLSNILPEDLVSLSSNIQKKNLIPFSKISIRLVEEKRTEVVDISITPSWSNYSDFNDGYSRLKIKRKFWNVASIQTPFFERYPDSELLSIFNPNQSKSHDSVIESNFFHSSEHLPEGHVLFIEDNDLEKEDKYVDLFDSPFTNFPPRGKERFAREIQFFMRNLIQEKKYYNIEYDIVFDDTEKSLFSEITNFIEYTKTLTADSETKFQSYIEEGEKLLLEIFELSKKYRGLSLFGNPYGTGFGNHTGDVTGISYQSYDDDNLFSYLFVLMDSYLHEHNPPKSSWGGPPDEQKYYDSEYSSEAFGELIEKVSDYQFHKFGTSVMESLPWRIFDDTPAYFDYIPTDNYIEGAVHEIEKKGMPMCWDDGWFIDAINNLRVTY